MTIPSIITVLQAHERGEQLQYRSLVAPSEWRDTPNPIWNFHEMEYRVKEKPKTIPLTPADVPPGSVVRRHGSKEGTWLDVNGCGEHGLLVEDTVGITYWSELAADWQILRPGGVWENASKALSP